jgi:hypothetical protein
MLGAACQLGATACLLVAMKQRNFIVGVAFSKTEVLQVGIFATLMLQEIPTLVVRLAMVVATIGVVLLSLPRQLDGKAWNGSAAAWFGLASGACFALSSVGYRGAALELPGHSAWLIGAWNVLLAQPAKPAARRLDRLAPAGTCSAIARAWRLSTLAGMMGALASIGWLTADGAAPGRGRAHTGPGRGVVQLPGVAPSVPRKNQSQRAARADAGGRRRAGRVGPVLTPYASDRCAPKPRGSPQTTRPERRRLPMPQIRQVLARRFQIPLSEVLSDAKHGDHTHFELITVTITLDDGSQGTGYTYTGGKGGHAIRAMVEHDLAPMLTGRDATDIDALYDAMQWHVHYVGRGGIASFAISAVDIALWDLRGKHLGQPLWKMAGGASDRCKAYCGGIDLNFPLPKLLDSIRGYLARGFDAVKIKVGQPDLADDVARVRAVRELIGPTGR